MAFTGEIVAATLANGTNSDVDTGNAHAVRLGGTPTDPGIGGFTGGVDGRLLIVMNATGTTVFFVKDDPGSVAGNRIAAYDGSVVWVEDGAMFWLVYNGNTERWYPGADLV